MSEDQPEVAVLGAGIAGLSIAWQLLRRGVAVSVVSGVEPAASAVAAGMLAPMPETEINPAIGRVAVAALRAYPEFLDSLAEDTDLRTGFYRCGLMRVAYSDEEAVAIRDSVGAYEAAGMPSRWLDARGCVSEAPGLGGAGLRGGLVSYEEAQVQADWVLAALRDAISHRGGTFVEAEVAAVTPKGTGVAVRLGAAGSTEELTATTAVVAMGSWSGMLAGTSLQVSPVKGQLLTFDGPRGPRPIVYWGHNYLLTKPDATVVLGATMEDAGYALDVDANAESLRDALDQLWPSLRAEPALARAGLRPAAADRLPVIGWAGPGVYAFTAHFRNGFLLSPMTAALAATEVVGGGKEEALARFRPDRLSAEGSAGA
ncbi:MAG TPA: FAD-dependent oxidoreductase [Candidatus Solibacter sp.]|jgi:glycine oxidase|nr:FAD-dependent oxidoreductase [Candidatus Solibacter sp.]